LSAAAGQLGIDFPTVNDRPPSGECCCVSTDSCPAIIQPWVICPSPRKHDNARMQRLVAIIVVGMFCAFSIVRLLESGSRERLRHQARIKRRTDHERAWSKKTGQEIGSDWDIKK
jgi:hypothetical protein